MRNAKSLETYRAKLLPIFRLDSRISPNKSTLCKCRYLSVIHLILLQNATLPTTGLDDRYKEDTGEWSSSWFNNPVIGRVIFLLNELLYCTHTFTLLQSREMDNNPWDLMSRLLIFPACCPKKGGHSWLLGAARIY